MVPRRPRHACSHLWVAPARTHGPVGRAPSPQHINTQNDLDGVVYMQNAMGYGIAPGTKLTVVWDGRFKEYAV